VTAESGEKQRLFSRLDLGRFLLFSRLGGIGLQAAYFIWTSTFAGVLAGLLPAPGS